LQESFNRLNIDQQASLLSAVKQRGDAYFLPMVTKAIQSAAQEVRIAALDALATIGDESSVIILAQTAAGDKDPEQKAARKSLYLLNAPKVDQTIVDQISSVNDEVKIELIYAIGERRIENAANNLVTLAEGENAKLRMAAYRALALIAKGDQMPQLVSYMSKAESKAERAEIERALVTISESMTAEESKSDAILKALATVTDKEVKSSLYMVLGRIGEESSLPILRSALQDADMDLRAAAIRALSEWPNAEPKDDLFQVAQKGEQPSHKVLALRGYIDLLGHIDEGVSGEKRTALYRQALDLKPDVQEIRKALSGLSRVGGLEALQLAAKYLDNEEVKEEAASAVARLSWSTAREHPDETKPYLEKIVQITTNERTKDWAENLLERINNSDR
jgi:HEAT repeat protein